MVPDDRHRNGAQSSRNDWCVLPVINYKNKLQEYMQKNRMGLPVYQTVNEGANHNPQFKSTVRVRNRPFTCSRNFKQKKRAEQDAARIALETLCPVRKVEEYPYPIVNEDAPFCKSILSQFSVDMQLGAPIYKTDKVERSLEVPVFVSSVHLNGFNFTGAKAKNKKEAEQLAARVMVVFFLERGDPQSVSVIAGIIKSKYHKYAAVATSRDTNNIFSKANSIVSRNESLPDDILQKEAADPLLPPCKKARLENPTQVISLEIVPSDSAVIIPSESMETLVSPPSESDHEKADGVVATEVALREAP